LCYHHESAAVCDRWRPLARAYGMFVPGRQGPAAASADSAGLCGRLPGREAGRFGMSRR